MWTGAALIPELDWGGFASKLTHGIVGRILSLQANEMEGLTSLLGVGQGNPEFLALWASLQGSE